MTHSTDERILRRLNPGNADPVLVADFQAMSMAPRLSERLSERVPDRTVFQIDAIGVLSGTRRYVPMAELAASCADEFAGSGAADGPVFVLGHCSAAPLALGVANLLAPARPVTALLVNPSWPDDAHVKAKFTEFLGKLGPVGRTAPDLDGDPERVVSAMEQVFVDEITALAASRGLSSTAGAFTELIIWYRAWLAFLLAGRNDQRDSPGARAAVTVLSDSPATLAVPGLDQGSYPVVELPPQPVGTVTPELAEIVATHVEPGLRAR